MSSSVLTVGVVHHAGSWAATLRARTHHGHQFLDVALSLTSQVLHVDGVAVVRACRGIGKPVKAGGVAILPTVRPGEAYVCEPMIRCRLLGL